MDNELLIKLLSEHNRLIIPGFGAFLRKEKSVGSPLVFSPFLKKDDGVLTNIIMNNYEVDESDAKSMITEWVSTIQLSLNQRQKYHIDGIGVLIVDANGAITMVADQTKTVQKTTPIISDANESQDSAITDSSTVNITTTQTPTQQQPSSVENILNHSNNTQPSTQIQTPTVQQIVEQQQTVQTSSPATQPQPRNVIPSISASINTPRPAQIQRPNNTPNQPIAGNNQKPESVWQRPSEPRVNTQQQITGQPPRPINPHIRNGQMQGGNTQQQPLGQTRPMAPRPVINNGVQQQGNPQQGGNAPQNINVSNNGQQRPIHGQRPPMPQNGKRPAIRPGQKPQNPQQQKSKSAPARRNNTQKKKVETLLIVAIIAALIITALIIYGLLTVNPTTEIYMP